MSKAVLGIVFSLLSLVNAAGSFFAIFPLLGMATNANGFLSGGTTEIMILVLIVSLPLCLILSGVLYRSRGAKVGGTIVAAIPLLLAATFLAVA